MGPPRWRGGATSPQALDPLLEGPSPLARGSLVRALRPGRPGGSIPAGAGEPSARRSTRRGSTVHPRWRGGARARTLSQARPGGPSPLARGSRLACAARVPLRSIPAGAGEPSCGLKLTLMTAVHPRWRGGAQALAASSGGLSGPSPLARGSPPGARQRPTRRRSIPAGAGEPQLLTERRSPSTVHPRWRGGAKALGSAGLGDIGPSPLARGSLTRLRLPW